MKLPFARGPWAVAFVAAALCLVSQVGYSATLPVTPATFDAVLAKAASGDVLSLSGAFGDLYVKKAVPVALACAPDATIRSLNITAPAGLTVQGCAVQFTPNASTVTWSSAVQVSGSAGVAFKGVRIIGGNAITGVAETATSLDSTGNVIGRPTARGLTITGSTDVTFDAGEVARFHKGIVIQASQRVTVSNSDLHDMRTTAIVGSNISDVAIANNRLHDAAPWNWGKGDHADFIAFWSDSTQTTPNTGIRITGNTLTGGEILVAGVPTAGVLGSWLQGTTAAPFTDVTYSGNTFILANLQGIALWNVKGGSIDHNTFWRNGSDPKWAPTILLRDVTSGISISANQMAAPLSDTQALGANLTSSNTVLSATANLYVAKTPTTVDPRDVQIATLTAANATLTAQLSDLTAKLKAANDNLATASATISTLQAQAVTADMALKTAQETQKATQAALDGAQAALAAKNAALAAIQTTAATAQAAH